MNQTTLDALSILAGGTAAIFAVFAALNLIRFPLEVARVVVPLNGILAIVFAAEGRYPRGQVPGTGTGWRVGSARDDSRSRAFEPSE